MAYTMTGRDVLNSDLLQKQLEIMVPQAYKAKQEMMMKEGHERIGLHASSILRPVVDRWNRGYCERECVLAQFYYPMRENFSAKTINTLENGVMIHQRWQEWFRYMGVARAIELPHIVAGYYLHFTPDAIVSDFLTDRRERPRVFELKGYNHAEYERLVAQPSIPPTDAYKQLQFYLHLLQIEEGAILVENKDTQLFHIWCVKRDASAAQEPLERLDSIVAKSRNHYETHALPARICADSACPRANNCSYRHVCFATQDEREHARLPPDDHFGNEVKEGPGYRVLPMLRGYDVSART